MLRSYDAVRCLVTATAVTAVVVAAGSLLTEPSAPQHGVVGTEATAEAGPGTDAAPRADLRGAVVGRDAARAAGTLPPYQLVAPVELEPAPEPAPAPPALEPTVLRPIPEPEPAAPFNFRIGTFNILGSQHTARSGRWAAGTTRAGFTASLIRERGLGLVGLQEVQRDQLGVLQRNLGGYQVWPGAGLGNNGIRLQIAYRTDLFEQVGTQTITTVFHRQHRPVPILRLRHRGTGGEFYVMNVHNSPLGMQGERESAKTAQIAKLNQLRAEGLPVLLVGDMNEKEGFFCRVGAATQMISANGGTTAGGCRMPGNAKIDWILGDQVSFSGYRQDVGGLVSRASDHHFVHADATVTPTVVTE